METLLYKLLDNPHQSILILFAFLLLFFAFKSFRLNHKISSTCTDSYVGFVDVVIERKSITLGRGFGRGKVLLSYYLHVRNVDNPNVKSTVCITYKDYNSFSRGDLAIMREVISKYKDGYARELFILPKEQYEYFREAVKNKQKDLSIDKDYILSQCDITYRKTERYRIISEYPLSIALCICAVYIISIKLFN